MVTKAEAGYRGARSQQIKYSKEEKAEMQRQAAWTRDTRVVDPDGVLSPTELTRRVDAYRKLRMAKVWRPRKRAAA